MTGRETPKYPTLTGKVGSKNNLSVVFFFNLLLHEIMSCIFSPHFRIDFTFTKWRLLETWLICGKCYICLYMESESFMIGNLTQSSRFHLK